MRTPLLSMVMVTSLSSVISDYYSDDPDIRADWDDSRRNSKQLSFPSDKEDECAGERMSLRSGETAVIKSHKSFGKSGYSNGYRHEYIIYYLTVYSHFLHDSGSVYGSDGSDQSIS